MSDDDSEDSSTATTSSEEEDECMLYGFYRTLVEGKGKGNTDPQILEGYSDAVRTKEIKAYIDNNKDALGFPDYFDDDMIVCGIADEVVKNEKARGTQFSSNNIIKE